jgi:threonine/homoserine/homoserine lactone efflux protein
LNKSSSSGAPLGLTKFITIMCMIFCHTLFCYLGLAALFNKTASSLSTKNIACVVILHKWSEQSECREVKGIKRT